MTRKSLELPSHQVEPTLRCQGVLRVMVSPGLLRLEKRAIPRILPVLHI
jgi:hypothetical protein